MVKLHHFLFLIPPPFKLGILKRSLLSLKKVELKHIPNRSYRTAAVYKHYILFFRSEEQSEDCIVFDTQEETVINAVTGLHLGARNGYSICYWKDNIFVLFGGTTTPSGTTISATGLTSSQKRMVPGVQFLEVTEENCKDVPFIDF